MSLFFARTRYCTVHTVQTVLTAQQNELQISVYKQQIRQKMENRKATNSAAIGELINPAFEFQRRKQATWRKQMKPDYARFKASIRYVDKEEYKPMFSIDIDRKKQDSEKAGLYGLFEWALKCLDNERLISIAIFMTERPGKETSVMDYNTKVFYYDRTMTMDKFKCIDALRFDTDTNRVMFDLAMKAEIIRQDEERAGRKKVFTRYSTNY